MGLCGIVVLCADSRFAEPRTSRKGTVLFFSLVRKEPKVPQRFANLWTPGTIQSSAGNSFGETSGGTSRNWFFAQNGGEKALNRCEVRVLQRKELERRLIEQGRSLVDSRLWLGANLRCRLRKLAAFEDSKMACSNRQCFGCEKGLFFQLMKSRSIKKGFFSAQQNFNFPPHPN